MYWFHRNGVKFLCCALHEAALWIRGEGGTDGRGKFQVLINNACTALGHFLILLLSCWQVGWGVWEVEGKHSWGSWPWLTEGLHRIMES